MIQLDLLFQLLVAFAIRFFKDPFADPDGKRRDFDHLVIPDPFNRLLK